MCVITEHIKYMNKIHSGAVSTLVNKKNRPVETNYQHTGGKSGVDCLPSGILIPQNSVHKSPYFDTRRVYIKLNTVIFHILKYLHLCDETSNIEKGSCTLLSEPPSQYIYGPKHLKYEVAFTESLRML